MSQNYRIRGTEEYTRIYNESKTSPEEFWGGIAEAFSWSKKWDAVLKWDFNQPEVKWFEGGKLNLSENCIDRHLNALGDKNAFIFEPNNPNEPTEYISYSELSKRVNRFANLLLSKGIRKGDRVCIYLPMIPDLPVAMLACARIGAIHSIVFAGFSAQALASRINDSDCKMVITSDGSFRGEKSIELKNIVDEALLNCTTVETVLVVKRIHSKVTMMPERDYWIAPLLEQQSEVHTAEQMDAEDPLFILYTSGSTGTPKGMVHTTGGYMVNAAYTFQNVFQYEPEDMYWCSADIGWITGHSYIVYGPLLNGATSVLFEGVPSYPDCGRFWQTIEKLNVNQFYTAPTTIRSLAKESLDFVNRYDLSSLKTIGTVGEPINIEAWNWYNDNVGKGKATVVDTWFQTETGCILISPIPNATPSIATFATLPLPGVQLVLLDDDGNEILGNDVKGKLCIKAPWPSMARTIWGNHQRYKETYFTAFPGYYFTGDGALRNEDGYYRITGRVDDVIIVSGHNLGTAPIENVINEHEKVAESAIVGVQHPIKGMALFGFVSLKTIELDDENLLKQEINQLIASKIGPIAKLDFIQFTQELPKTRSGKIMRRILRKIANNESDSLGDVSTLLNPPVVAQLIELYNTKFKK